MIQTAKCTAVSNKEPPDDCRTALTWIPEARRKKDRPTDTWITMTEKDRNELLLSRHLKIEHVKGKFCLCPVTLIPIRTTDLVI